MPWRNGRGTTLELASEPSTQASTEASTVVRDFAWRVSIASVLEDGPFSLFPGVERTLVVLDEGALELDHGHAAPRARIGALEPYVFAGEWPTTCRLLDRPVRDLNVMTRRGEARATVEVLRAGASRVLALDTRIVLVFAARGTSILAAAGERTTLAQESLVRLSADEDAEDFEAWTENALLLVRLDA